MVGDHVRMSQEHYFYCVLYFYGAFLMAQMVKNLPAMQETQVKSLGWEDPLEEEVAIHSTILAWRIPWIEGPGSYSLQGCTRVQA